MNWTSRIRRASVATAVAAAMSAATAGDAHAWTNYYCGVLISSGSWCGDGSNHTYDTNKAEYKGSGYVRVCERLLYADTTATRNGYTCDTNRVYRNYGLTTTLLFEAEVTHTDNSRHTIYGTAVA